MTESHSATDPSPSSQPFSVPARLGYVFVAALSSIGLAGLGQVYTRNWKRAAAYFVGTFACWFVLLGWLVHLASIVDAAVTTWKATGQPDARSDDRWGLVWTAVFVAIGFALLGLFSFVMAGNLDVVQSMFRNWSAVFSG